MTNHSITDSAPGKPDDRETQALLRRIAMQTQIGIGLASLSAVLLLFVLLFPQHAEKVSAASVQAQLWLEPYVGGALGIVFALVVVFLSAAYVVSRIFPGSSSESPVKTTELKNSEGP